MKRFVTLAVLLWGVVQGQSYAESVTASPSADLKAQNEQLFQQIQKVHNLSDAQMTKIREIFNRGNVMGQGNPAVTQHPMTPEQCLEKGKAAGIDKVVPEWEKKCGAKFMAPLYDPKTQKEVQARSCIDQFEFPNIPCAYPVVWVKAKEAQEICAVMGKRMCDAHEWEGGCAGALEDADYPFDQVKSVGNGSERFRRMRAIHNNKYNSKKTWAYGDTRKKGNCAMNSFKHDKCNGGNWQNCGSNTYPTGSFPDCKSALGVYDQHGNAAEHMNLPTTPEEMASHPSRKLGHTEMKGSWFIWDKFEAHPDQCRWRAPYWHGTKVMDDHSHHNYHLGFRCCKDVE